MDNGLQIDAPIAVLDEESLIVLVLVGNLGTMRLFMSTIPWHANKGKSLLG
jgi:hypothetical protein